MVGIRERLVVAGMRGRDKPENVDDVGDGDKNDEPEQKPRQDSRLWARPSIGCTQIHHHHLLYIFLSSPSTESLSDPNSL